MVILVIDNNNWGRLEGDIKECRELYKAFSIRHPDAFFLSRSMPRGWDGKIHYITEKGKFKAGLLEVIGAKCDELGIQWDVADFRTEKLEKPKKVTKRGKWALRDYQEAAVKAFVTRKVKGVLWPRGIVQVATNGGKCVGLNTLINTGWGLVKAQELKELKGIPVINHELNRVYTSNFIDSGVIDTLIIETHQGYNIEVGESNHRLWLSNSNSCGPDLLIFQQSLSWGWGFTTSPPMPS